MLIELVNRAGAAIQAFDDAAVTRDDDPPADALRDAAHELHHHLTIHITKEK